MNAKRSQRLRILQCFVDNSKILRIDRSSESKYPKELIDFILTFKNADDVIKGLRSLDVVTRFYSKDCLFMDLWFLLKTYIKGLEMPEFSTLTVDPEAKALLLITVRALIDLQTARPCDVDIWRIDKSSDCEKCSHQSHICWRNAEEYLLDIDPEKESFMGLTPGTIQGLVTRIKSDKLFDITGIFK